MSDPWVPGKIGVTIKVPESKKYAGDNPWFVFEGTDVESVKQKILETFGMPDEGLDLASVVVNAQRMALNLGNVMHGLGGTVISPGPAQEQTSSSLPSGSSFGGGDRGGSPAGGVWAQAQQQASSAPPAQQPAQEEVDVLMVQIENCQTVAELQQLWAENQEAFNQEKYMSAYKAKGKALSANPY